MRSETGIIVLHHVLEIKTVFSMTGWNILITYSEIKSMANPLDIRDWFYYSYHQYRWAHAHDPVSPEL
jgi:hypothetical protein